MTTHRLSTATRACRGRAAAPVPQTSMPAHHLAYLRTIAVLTDEHFSCPPGFGRVLDITDPEHITLLSTYHIRGIDDQYDHDKKQFICPDRLAGIAHMAEFDHRVKAGNLFYQAWYNQGLAAQSTSPIPSDHARSAITSLRISASMCRARRAVIPASPIRTGKLPT